MKNATPSTVVIEMHHLDNAHRLESALDRAKNFMAGGGDAELLVKVNGEVHDCGVVGHDVQIVRVRHTTGPAPRSHEPCAALGSPLAGGFFAGEMTINGERYALVVAPKAEGEKLELEYKKNDRNTADGTDSDDDGLANSKRISDANHPAAQFCRSLKIGGFDDWYLPSRDELAMLWRNLGPRRKGTPELFREGGAEAFAPDWYWSSTETASYSTYAWVVGFGYGYQGGNAKYYTFGVRAVRRLKL